MKDVATPGENGSAKLRGRELRSVTLTIKLTALESTIIEAFASQSGKRTSEWAREVLLHHCRREREDFDLICEIVGLQLLVMNVLAPVARGEQISTEHFQGIVKSVQAAKVKAAEEMLARRRANQG
jgi:hypothetical protein